MKKTLLLCLLLCALLLTACTAPVPAKDCAEVSQALLSSQNFTEEMVEQSESRMRKVLGLTEGQYTQAVMAIDASRATPEAVIVVNAADQAALKEVQALLKDYLESLLTQYRDYRPDEVPKLTAAAVQTNGLQCVLVIAPDQAAAQAALKEAWK